jgi:glucose 1-dehydrogenase
MPGKLDGRVAVVTGGDSGIGRDIAELFGREGADVMILYHSDAAGAEAACRSVAAAGRRAEAHQVDVRDQRAVSDAFDLAVSRLGTPSILVNSAGVGDGGMPVAETPGDAWDRVIRTDLNGPFYCCRAFLQACKTSSDHDATARGKIINITSVHEAIPSPDAAAYGAAKGGLLTFTRSLALEAVRDRINVNAIAPGLIRTPMTAARVNDPEALREAESHIPLGRAGEPEEIAFLALYLASPEADYVTGQSFTIDGGLEMNWGQGA